MDDVLTLSGRPRPRATGGRAPARRDAPTLERSGDRGARPCWTIPVATGGSSGKAGGSSRSSRRPTPRPRSARSARWRSIMMAVRRRDLFRDPPVAGPAEPPARVLPQPDRAAAPGRGGAGPRPRGGHGRRDGSQLPRRPRRRREGPPPADQRRAHGRRASPWSIPTPPTSTSASRSAATPSSTRTPTSRATPAWAPAARSDRPPSCRTRPSATDRRSGSPSCSRPTSVATSRWARSCGSAPASGWGTAHAPARSWT